MEKRRLGIKSVNKQMEKYRMRLNLRSILKVWEKHQPPFYPEIYSELVNGHLWYRWHGRLILVALAIADPCVKVCGNYNTSIFWIYFCSCVEGVVERTLMDSSVSVTMFQDTRSLALNKLFHPEIWPGRTYQWWCKHWPCYSEKCNFNRYFILSHERHKAWQDIFELYFDPTQCK